jgi:hypothetical protein
MNIADPKFLQHLRDLPSSYLLDLMADNDDIDRESIVWVLMERGLAREDIAQKLQQRQSLRMRPYNFWMAARWLTLFNTLIVTYFNVTGLYRLMHDDHSFKGALLFLAFVSMAVGFIIGFKLTTHIYHGSKSLLYCGFPLPVGYVELTTGEEVLKDKALLNIRMALNALVGISMALFPISLIYLCLD